jgi:5-(carboxyamino)imidazole ribonucleotide mutase
MALVTVIVGSATDRPIVDPVLEILRKYRVAYDLHVVSAHRDPDRLIKLVKEAEEGGTRVFIAAAGMAAHLAGAVAAQTVRPVIGLPVGSGPLKGQDSLLSTVMMPSGIPVATVAIDGGKNAAWLALEILALLPDGAKIENDLVEERERMRGLLQETEEKWHEDLESGTTIPT